MWPTVAQRADAAKPVALRPVRRPRTRARDGRRPLAGRRRDAAVELHQNSLGGVHGGVVSTPLDTAAGCAVHSTLAVGLGCTCIHLVVKFGLPFAAA